MKAARLHEGLELRVEDVAEPTPGFGEIRVAVRAAGVCGTDVHAAHGRLPVPRLPVVLGHEGAGVVDAVGEGVAELREGDRVLLLPSETCGACRFCAAGHLGLCPEARILGMARDGTFADRIVVPAWRALAHAAGALADLASRRGDPVRVVRHPPEAP